ncbi:excinuclease ABC subunit UvrC [Geomobilimonas luticola]|uniref:UvrABC system protein C n=1 Tax=Geomobilimonas luticola TaxID=1114878 RepID=A0ABS5SDF2_9BACT|nr:excinuclease ABC subunit UvrC [Geomobilimonas luticola]MBT0653409.1 excinuclease ABC subunit UvrC [Geomobilimonas luticola]
MLDSTRIDNLPSAPGVYLMKGKDGQVLYVGKARELKKRVRSYFTAARDARYHIRFLMERVADIQVIVTDTENEALILENTLIKRYRPRYNFNLRDDKTYFSLRLDPTEEFPRLGIVRKVPRDGARYFGPYASAAAAREVLKQLYKIFPLRHYPLETCRRRRRPCLFHQLRQCSAPCHGLISPQDYAALVDGATLFLSGRSNELVRLFRQRMETAAGKEEYETAARYRDLLQAIRTTVEKQKMVSHAGDTDVTGFHRDGNRMELSLLFIRGGSLIGSRSYSLAWELDDAEGIASFLREYYSGEVMIPDELLVPLPLPESDAFAEFLGVKRGKRVAVAHPLRGTKLELVRLAEKNAATSAREKEQRAADSRTILAELQERLHLPRPPRRIECYDISNLQGGEAVGSGVAFADGRPDKANYRRYRIRTVSGANDFAMLHEVLSRRFGHQQEDAERPDLIIIDGGPGQLNVLTAVLRDLGVDDVAAASLAKSRVDREMAATEIRRSDERVFLPGRKNPVVLRQNSSPLLLLARIRDEAHRFAITYHKTLRSKASLTSKLDEIPGVGTVRKKSLLRHFGSLKRITAATAEELAGVPGITGELARTIHHHLATDKKGGT